MSRVPQIKILNTKATFTIQYFFYKAQEKSPGEILVFFFPLYLAQHIPSVSNKFLITGFKITLQSFQMGSTQNKMDRLESLYQI